MKKIFLVALLCLSALGAAARDISVENNATPADSGLSTIPALDVKRYMGTWFEIAKYPTWFQKKCAGNSRANYSLMGDGQVQVINRCRMAGGELSEAIGVARQVGPATSPKLEVRFAPA